MVLSDGTTSSLSDLFAEHNPDKKVEYDLKRCQPKWGNSQLIVVTYEYVNDDEQDTKEILEIIIFQVDFLIYTNKTTEANFTYSSQLDMGFSHPVEAFWNLLLAQSRASQRQVRASFFRLPRM